MPPIESPTRKGIVGPTPSRNSCRASANAAMLTMGNDAAPRPRRAADSVQEHKRRQAGIAGGLITEAAIPGFHGREMRHAGPPVKSDLPMLTGPLRLKSNNFIFKAILDRRGVRL